MIREAVAIAMLAYTILGSGHVRFHELWSERANALWLIDRIADREHVAVREGPRSFSINLKSGERQPPIQLSPKLPTGKAYVRETAHVLFPYRLLSVAEGSTFSQGPDRRISVERIGGSDYLVQRSLPSGGELRKTFFRGGNEGAWLTGDPAEGSFAVSGLSAHTGLQVTTTIIYSGDLKEVTDRYAYIYSIDERGILCAEDKELIRNLDRTYSDAGILTLLKPRGDKVIWRKPSFTEGYWWGSDCVLGRRDNDWWLLDSRTGKLVAIAPFSFESADLIYTFGDIALVGSLKGGKLRYTAWCYSVK